MKRILCCFICFLLMGSFVGCNSEPITLRSGNYYAAGDYEIGLRPYFMLDTSDNTFLFGGGSVLSYAEYGAYEIVDGKIIATSQSTTYTFVIQDENTLVLIGNGENEGLKIPVNLCFVFSEELK